MIFEKYKEQNADFKLSNTCANTQLINIYSSQMQPDTFGGIFKVKVELGKIFEGEIIIRKLPSTIFQIFCKIMFDSKVLIKVS